jgi:excisionase family DNA binding protein
MSVQECYQVPVAALQHIERQKSGAILTDKLATRDLNPINNGGTKVKKVFDNLITKGELAQTLQVSISYVEKLMANEGLPHFKIGRSVRFRYEEVREWLLRRRFP